MHLHIVMQTEPFAINWNAYP